MLFTQKHHRKFAYAPILPQTVAQPPCNPDSPQPPRPRLPFAIDSIMRGQLSCYKSWPHTGDVYSVNFHPSAEQIVTAGYDRTIRIFDTSAGVEQRALIGHELPARAAVFNATGNLVVSGGKDATLRFWDVRSALCVRKLGHSLGEVTSVQLSPCGTQLLASS